MTAGVGKERRLFIKCLLSLNERRAPPSLAARILRIPLRAREPPDEI